MAKYVLLLQYTDQGIRSVKNTTKRAAALKGEIAGKFGVKVSEVLWTLGQYDGVIVAEAPNDEAMAACSLSLAMLGNVKIQTLRAFQAPEASSPLRENFSAQHTQNQVPASRLVSGLEVLGFGVSSRKFVQAALTWTGQDQAARSHRNGNVTRPPRS